MPQKMKKEHTCSQQQSGSRWHNVHFSGKLILFSVIFGLMLVLVGGILMAIGMDSDNDNSKSDNYNDLQKKPPLAIVGPVIMGIGGFTVIIGVLMCLVETKVCRRKSTDTSPLISEDATNQEFEDAGTDTDPTAIPSTSRHYEKRRQGNHKKSPSPRKSRHSHSPKDRTRKKSPSPNSPSSAPISVISNSSKNFLSASDRFVTPVNSFAPEYNVLQTHSRDAENQTSTSLINSVMSWSISAEFQTPGTSFEDSLSMESSDQIKELKTSLATLNAPNANVLQIPKHAFLTPVNSDAENKKSQSSSFSSEEHILKEGSSTETLGGNDTSHSHSDAQSEGSMLEVNVLAKEIVDDVNSNIDSEPQKQQDETYKQNNLESVMPNAQESTAEVGVNFSVGEIETKHELYNQSKSLDDYKITNYQIHTPEYSKHEFLTPKSSDAENMKAKSFIADELNQEILEKHIQDKVSIGMVGNVNNVIQEPQKYSNNVCHVSSPHEEKGESNEIHQNAVDEKDNLNLPIADALDREQNTDTNTHEQIKCEEIPNDDRAMNCSDAVISDVKELTVDTNEVITGYKSDLEEIVCEELKDSNLKENNDLENSNKDTEKEQDISETS